jgi:uncharacterized membrane protein YjjP (DUF1212 family)
VDDKELMTKDMCNIKHKEVDDLKADVNKIFDKLDSHKTWMILVLGGLIANLVVALLKTKG